MKYLMIAILALAVSCSKQPSMTDELDALFDERYGDAQAAPGAAIVIAKGDSIIYERYIGIADMESGEKIDSATRFNIASVSKQFTVAALLQQDVDIDRPVSDFFDYPQPFWHKVTLRHLASHTSGVPDSRDRSDRSKCVFATDSTSEAYFPTVTELKFAPGTAYDYLNPSFILLAHVVEQLTGEKFTDYQQRHIFDPLGMDATYYFEPEEQHEHTAHGYVTADGGATWEEYDYGEETFFATKPDGGIYSTARDMLKWETGLAEQRVLSAEKRDMAYTPQIQVTGSEWCDYQNRADTWYGLGWFVDTTPGHPVKVYHTGDNGGFQAYVAKYPDLGYSIIVLENRNDKDRWAMATAIDEILLSGH